jgi:hypothetical protein
LKGSILTHMITFGDIHQAAIDKTSLLNFWSFA